MKHGILNEWDDEKVQEMNKDGLPVEVGVSAESVLLDIDAGLIQSGYNAGEVLRSIHRDLMLLTGKIVIKPVPKSEDTAEVKN